MTSNANTSDATTGRATIGRSRCARFVAATLTAGLAVGFGAGFDAAHAATASADGPQAQSVGNFLDATLGGSPIDSVAKLKYAKAVAPGSNGVQNPLDVTLFNQANVPLTGQLQLPAIGSTSFGAANQVAKANKNGAAYGAAGAVSNSGGVSSGGDNNAYPASGKIGLNGSSLGASPIAIPGGASAAALGGVQATIGAVSSLASTPEGYGKGGSTKYNIADVDLSIGSPALGAALTSLLGQVTAAFTNANATLGKLPSTLTGCTLTSPEYPQTLSFDNGAVTINAKTGTISVSLKALLKTLGVDLNDLPANTDLTEYLLAYLTDANGLAKGLPAVLNGITTPLQDQFATCAKAVSTALAGTPLAPLATALNTLAASLRTGQATLESVAKSPINTIIAAGGVNPLKPLADQLKQLLDIGVNVQPNGKKGTYSDPLAATPKQGTAVVPGQIIVRAIEVNVAAAAGSSLPTGSIPGLGSLPGASSLPAPFARPYAAAAASTGILTVGLANSAAGPSVRPAVASATPSASDAPVSASGTVLPTGVPAGAGSHGGTPVLPLVLILLVAGLAAGGVVTYRVRGSRTTH